MPLLAAAEGLGVRRSGACWFGAKSRARFMNVQGVFHMKGLQNQTICLENFPVVASEILKLIPDYIPPGPDPQSQSFNCVKSWLTKINKQMVSSRKRLPSPASVGTAVNTGSIRMCH